MVRRVVFAVAASAMWCEAGTCAPAAPVRHVAVTRARTAEVQLPIGTHPAAAAFHGLAAPVRKPEAPATAAPSPDPFGNPLKRRRMATNVPAGDAGVDDLAF